MGKNRANRRNRKQHKKQARKRVEGNGAQEAPAEAAGKPVQLKIKSKEKVLAAKLMAARSATQRNKVALAGLYDENIKLRKEVLQAQINAEARENELTAEEYGLPLAFGSMGKDEDGDWYVTCEPKQIPKSGREEVKIPDPPESSEPEEPAAEKEAPEPEPKEGTVPPKPKALLPAGKAEEKGPKKTGKKPPEAKPEPEPEPQEAAK